MAGLAEVNLHGILVSAAGAVVMLFIFHTFLRRTV
jgi:hypothetical protein